MKGREGEHSFKRKT